MWGRPGACPASTASEATAHPQPPTPPVNLLFPAVQPQTQVQMPGTALQDALSSGLRICISCTSVPGSHPPGGDALAEPPRQFGVMMQITGTRQPAALLGPYQLMLLAPFFPTEMIFWVTCRDRKADWRRHLPAEPDIARA